MQKITANFQNARNHDLIALHECICYFDNKHMKILKGVYTCISGYIYTQSYNVEFRFPDLGSLHDTEVIALTILN